jgi:Putative auto-transporter adhesin, head GIN domain
VAKIILTVVGLIGLTLFLSACGVVGSGNIVSQERQVEEFTEVEFEGVGQIMIEQGNKNALKIETDDNIQPYIQVETFNNRLKVSIKDGFQPLMPKKLNYYLTVKDLSLLKTSGAGNVQANNMKLNNLKIEISGLGNVSFSGSAKSQEINVSGAGSYKAADFSTQDTKVTLSGLGNAEVAVNSKLNVSISGAGSVTYSGNPSEISENISGLGSVSKR